MGKSGEEPPPDVPGPKAATSHERRQQAGFSIFLDQVVDAAGIHDWETRLYHAESGVETTFQGASPEEWITWMLELLGPEARRSTSVDSAKARATVELASVELVDLTTAEEADDAKDSLHTIRAQVVVRVTGASQIEQAIGSQLLRTIAESGPRHRSGST